MPAMLKKVRAWFAYAITLYMAVGASWWRRRNGRSARCKTLFATYCDSGISIHVVRDHQINGKQVQKNEWIWQAPLSDVLFDELNIGDSMPTYCKHCNWSGHCQFANISGDHFMLTRMTSLDGTILLVGAHGYYILSKGSPGLYLSMPRKSCFIQLRHGRMPIQKPVYLGNAL